MSQSLTEATAAAPPRRTFAIPNPPRWARFVARRLVRGLVVLFALSLLAFGLAHLLPGSPVDTLAGPYSDPATRARLTADLGLDQPLPVQYVTWLSNTLHGNLGTS